MKGRWWIGGALLALSLGMGTHPEAAEKARKPAATRKTVAPKKPVALKPGVAKKAEAAKKPPEQCAVHGVELKPDQVRILYGPPPFMKGEMEARARLFPNARTLALGGCVVTKESPEFQKVWFCPKCREVESAWRRENYPQPKPANPD